MTITDINVIPDQYCDASVYNESTINPTASTLSSTMSQVNRYVCDGTLNYYQIYAQPLDIYTVRVETAGGALEEVFYTDNDNGVENAYGYYNGGVNVYITNNQKFWVFFRDDATWRLDSKVKGTQHHDSLLRFGTISGCPGQYKVDDYYVSSSGAWISAAGAQTWVYRIRYRSSSDYDTLKILQTRTGLAYQYVGVSAKPATASNGTSLGTIKLAYGRSNIEQILSAPSSGTTWVAVSVYTTEDCRPLGIYLNEWQIYDPLKMPRKYDIIYVSDTQLTGFTPAAASHTYQDNVGILSYSSPVTSLSSSAFASCAMSAITLPDTVTSIGASAFYNCTSLTQLLVPRNVTTVGNSAFKGCTNLLAADIPTDATTIGTEIYSGCTSLEHVIIPNAAGLTRISTSMYYGCTTITYVKIPTNIKTIGSSAFATCTRLLQVYIPASVTSIEANAFQGCTSLSSIVYKNTKSSWIALSKGTGWNTSMPSDAQIECNDGLLDLNNHEISLIG